MPFRHPRLISVDYSFCPDGTSRFSQVRSCDGTWGTGSVSTRKLKVIDLTAKPDACYKRLGFVHIDSGKFRTW